MQECKPLMWERLKYTKRFDWVDQSKVISLFFSSIYLWYPLSILFNARLLLFFFINIFMISKVNVDQSKVISLFFSSIYLWYPRSIFTKTRLFLYFFIYIFMISKVNIDQSKVYTAFDHWMTFWFRNQSHSAFDLISKYWIKTNTKWKRTSLRRESLWQKLLPNNPRFTTSLPIDPCSSLQKENSFNSPVGLAGSMWLPSCSRRSVENLKLQSNLDVAVSRNVDFLSEKPVHVNRRTAKKQKIMIVVKRKSLQLDYT